MFSYFGRTRLSPRPGRTIEKAYGVTYQRNWLTEALPLFLRQWTVSFNTLQRHSNHLFIF